MDCIAIKEGFFIVPQGRNVCSTSLGRRLRHGTVWSRVLRSYERILRSRTSLQVRVQISHDKGVEGHATRIEQHLGVLLWLWNPSIDHRRQHKHSTDKKWWRRRRRKCFDVSLEENFLSPNPLLVLRTSRSDRLSFRFVDGGTCAEFLSLNRTTGEIRHLRTFDHETTPMLVCKVSIECGSESAEVVPIRVNVVDRNDEKPR